MEQNHIQEKILHLNKDLQDTSVDGILKFFLKEYRHRIAFASSMGAEDQVLTQMISAIDNDIRIFTLDTGRLFQETYDLIEKTNARYKIQIDIMFPDNKKVQQMVKEHGINLFYQSVEFRKLCCNTRKIEPLTRALDGIEVWISGIRNEQSVTRKDIQLVEWDANFNLIKINPLKDWKEDQLWDYINQMQIPYNSLHDKGFPSIGCQPCTRTVEPGEDIRAGRWWWEQPEMKECGLHKK